MLLKCIDIYMVLNFIIIKNRINDLYIIIKKSLRAIKYIYYMNILVNYF